MSINITSGEASIYWGDRERDQQELERNREQLNAYRHQKRCTRCGYDWTYAIAHYSDELCPCCFVEYMIEHSLVPCALCCSVQKAESAESMYCLKCNDKRRKQNRNRKREVRRKKNGG